MTKADEVLKKIEAKAQQEFLPIIGPEKGRILVKAITKVKPKRVLEIGTLVGYSTILISRELDTQAELTTIEIHAKEAEQAEENIRKAQISPRIHVIVGDAIEVIPTLRDCFDAVFIDADKTEYYQYLRLMEDKLHKATVIVADNAGIFADQMHDYLEYVRKSGKFRSTYYRVGEDGVEVSYKL